MTQTPETKRSWIDRAGIAVVTSRVGAPFFRRIMHVIDRPLLRLTRGRFGLSTRFPTLLLTTTGAKSGAPRTVPLLYVECDGGWAVIGTRFGSTRHPGWYHNLRRHPEATVEIRSRRYACTAREATDAEREQIWPRAVSMYPGYETYRGRANRRIPIIILTPKPDGR